MVRPSSMSVAICLQRMVLIKCQPVSVVMLSTPYLVFTMPRDRRSRLNLWLFNSQNLCHVAIWLTGVVRVNQMRCHQHAYVFVLMLGAGVKLNAIDLQASAATRVSTAACLTWNAVLVIAMFA